MVEAIEVDTDRDFQERFWVIVRVGWVAMALLCLSAVFGLTGSGGPYSSQTIQAGGARIDLPANRAMASFRHTHRSRRFPT